jgi:hypothetical protein
MAGSGIRGQFEEKFKALIRDIEDEVRLPSGMVPFLIPNLSKGWRCHLLHRRSPYVIWMIQPLLTQ